MIRSLRSKFAVVLSSLPEVAGRLGELSTRANRLLSDENIASITRLAQSLDRAGSTLPQMARDAGTLIADLRSTTSEARTVIDKVRVASETAAPDLAAALTRLRATADHLATASNQLDGLIADNRQAIGGFMHQGLPEIEALARDGRAAAREFQELSRSLKQNPSQLLYEPLAGGVEVPQ